MPCRCGNVAAILELDENLKRDFKVAFEASLVTQFSISLPLDLTSSQRLQVFQAAAEDARGIPAKKAAPDYFL